MKAKWPLQDAKNRLSEVIQRALNDGPQLITKRGVETAVLISIDDFKSLTRKKGTLVSFLRHSPLSEVNLDRDDDTGRDIEL